MSPNDKFSFGYEKVSASEKNERVSRVFKSVASSYDLMNDLMSFGLHRVWKTWFVDSLPLKDGGVYLDVAGGTGDIAQAIFERLNRYSMRANIFVSDINFSMIQKGKQRRPHLTWLDSNAESLPLRDSSVDVYTISFGLRNVTLQEQALEEAYRVLKPGGKFLCLEFSHVSAPLEGLYDIYAFHIIPKIGKWVAADEDAYQYLSESIRTFMTREELAQMMENIGFEKVRFKSFSGGIVALHTGYKL